MSAETLTVGSDYYVTNIRGRANSAIGGKKFSDLAVKGDIPAAVSANPTLSGSETELTALQIGSAKYKIPSGGGGDVTAAGDNTFTGTNTFQSNVTFTSTDGLSDYKTYVGVQGIHCTNAGDVGTFYMDGQITNGTNTLTLPFKTGTLALNRDIPAAVSANPTLSGSETELTGLQIGSTKYKIPSGGSGGGGSGSGGCTLDDLETEYKESIANEDIENVNAVPVLDVENTGYWTMVPVSELGGGGGSGKKYYNHYVTITYIQGSVRNNFIFNIVSTSDVAFTKNNIYLHLRKDQLCVCKVETNGSYVKDDYSAYISDCTTTHLGVALIGGNIIIAALSDLVLTDSVTLISDL